MPHDLAETEFDKDPLYKDVFHESVDLKDDGTVRNADFLRAMKLYPKSNDNLPALSLD
jgi:hypothetical protein